MGKSTLVNRMLGEERVIVYDQAGTTRDSIYIPFERNEEKYTLIDTAGVRRRGKIFEAVEKFSVVKTLQAIQDANVVIFVMDAREGVVEHDLNLLGFVLETGRALVIALNKWDGMEAAERDYVKPNWSGACCSSTSPTSISFRPCMAPASAISTSRSKSPSVRR